VFEVGGGRSSAAHYPPNATIKDQRTMTSSDILISKLKEFEGLRLTAYKPVATERHYTIGYGHYGASVKRGMKITEAEAENLLRRDLVRFEAGVNELNVCKTQGQFDALVDFTFNLGMAALQGSTLLKKIKANAPTSEIQAQFKRWVYSGKTVLKGLVRRREWEAQRWAQ